VRKPALTIGGQLPAEVNIAADLELLAGVAIAIAGIAAAFVIRAWVLKIAVMLIAALVAVYVAGFWLP
jgi:hypothetical protein